MPTYRIEYRTFDNWDGDWDEFCVDAATPPTKGDVSEMLFSEVRDLRVTEVLANSPHLRS